MAAFDVADNNADLWLRAEIMQVFEVGDGCGFERAFLKRAGVVGVNVSCVDSVAAGA